MTDTRAFKVGCTDRGQHPWTTLDRLHFTVRGAPGETWSHAAPGQPYTVTCPRCGRAPRFSGKRAAQLQRALDTLAREGRGGLDVSLLPF